MNSLKDFQEDLSTKLKLETMKLLSPTPPQLCDFLQQQIYIDNWALKCRYKERHGDKAIGVNAKSD